MKEKRISDLDINNLGSEIAESEPELEETQRLKPEPVENSDSKREFHDTLTSPVPRPAVQTRHAKFDDLPLQLSTEEEQNSALKSFHYQSENHTITESVNKSMREDGTVSISDMLNHAHQTERASDFISRIEEEEEKKLGGGSPVKQYKKLKSPTKRLMQHNTHTPTPKKNQC